LLARDQVAPDERRFALSGRPVDKGAAAASPLVCACFAVPRAVIEIAIAKGATSVDAIGRATQAGTNCGSCRAEIRQLVKSRELVAAAVADGRD
jgi:assimilatory nitrate reductase catalytic subunit